MRDAQGNGPGTGDTIGAYTLDDGKRVTTQSIPWSRHSTLEQERYQRLYNHAIAASLAAVEYDRKHLQRIQALKSSSPFRFRHKVKKKIWKVWKKGAAWGQIQQEGKTLVVAFGQDHPKQKRGRLTRWFRKLTSAQTQQAVYLDRGKPGLNPKDSDQLGVRTRQDKEWQNDKLSFFRSLPLLQKIRTRRSYRTLIRAAYETSQNKQ